MWPNGPGHGGTRRQEQALCCEGGSRDRVVTVEGSLMERARGVAVGGRERDQSVAAALGIRAQRGTSFARWHGMIARWMAQGRRGSDVGKGDAERPRIARGGENRNTIPWREVSVSVAVGGMRCACVRALHEYEYIHMS